ncbi:MAG: alanine--glyoxylate aminotransferase family protein, partial [archaeon]|nr:alanine--glyoxylate aminotransferase family protein [archaeon]
MSKMFTVGPVSMYPSTLRIRGEQIPYFRTKDFSEIMLDSEERFKRLVRADPSSKVVFLTSSGTGAMEASVINFFDRNDRLL